MTSIIPTPSLSADQLETYLEYIGIPKCEDAKATAAQRRVNLPFLAQLLEHHICAIPYENLGMHYSQTKTISLDVQELYTKCMSNGRGGYCLENTVFFNHVLRGLGFHAYIVGARARPRVNGVPKGDFTGWLHTVNIVRFSDGSKYMADVAFGGDLSTKPLLLEPGQINVNMGNQQVRLERGAINGSLSGQHQWLYQYRNHVSDDWNTCFAFTETEFLPQDLEVMNWYTSQDPRCFLASAVLVVRFLREDDKGIHGKRMLVNHEVKENLGGKTSVLKTCKTESERIDALKEFFSIHLTAEEAKGINGTKVALDV